METLKLTLRSRVERFKDIGDWEGLVVERTTTIPAVEVAILVCDMWDKHWCPTATARVNELAHAMNAVLGHARRLGVQIIHSPSDTMTFYAEHPQYIKMRALPKIAPPAEIRIEEGPFPIDHSDGGCDAPKEDQTLAPNTMVWTRQHEAIEIAGDDVISEEGAAIYSFLRGKNISYLIVMGVHTNMCVIRRSFGLAQMTRWGVKCALVRDLTDSMYNPSQWPHVDHFTGTDMVIEHIEKYFCPTITSEAITGKPPFRFQGDQRTHGK